MTRTPISSNTSAELVDFIARRAAELAAEIIVTRLRQEPGIGSPRYATADSNPLNSRRAFLNAHRAKSFPTFKQGRNVAALWSDVEAWMRQRPEPRQTGEEGMSLDEALSAAAAPKRMRRAL